MAWRARTVIGLLGAAGVAAWARAWRPRHLTWGATPDEVARALPGDDLVRSPTFNATRAISVGAPPERIWPWLVQVGVRRAGWYSYDLLDNLGRPSARQIRPEWQALEPGDTLPMSPDGKHGINVYSMDYPRSMVWGTPADTTWVWQLDPQPDGTTRLLTRIRSRIRWSPASIAFSALLEVADFWMIRKMLAGLRERAEQSGTSPGGEDGRTPARSAS
ncbi:hypothetical protein [Pseudarthrobacter sp. GA104]|uniref:hypothetical protein n=1 Tax=Pseudarthrobacter sp. GA104 TaxID=2676311 RepID=UPI0012FA63F0|nr:hypothetical protein [Pseudarthrobacter sp. GA104]MUU73082.1 hypothetical protein [Pseudarthrobacter sp. GA104]